MSAQIGLENEARDISLEVGESAPVTFTITNAGNVVDAFDLSVRDLDPAWYTLTPERVSLFPHAEATVGLVVHPHAQGLAPAGDYTFEIVARSRADTTSETGVSLQ